MTQEPLHLRARPWFAREHRDPCCEPHPLIEVDGLSLRYGDHVAFSDVTMSIPRGCITALVGPSGCGKSSFLMALNRLSDVIPSARVDGEVRLEGRDTRGVEVDLVGLRRRVGMIFQKPNPFPFSIRRNLAYPLKEHGVRSKADRDDRIEAGLRDVGLWDEVKDRLDTSALGLSGGQQQRLCLARALVLQPEVLLLDEPCSALDPIAAGVVEELIERLRGRLTVVIVTHNLAQARRIADYVALFWVRGEGGQLVEYDTASAFFEDPEHELTRAYISGARG